MTGRYKVITLCGSTRFKDQFHEAQKRLTLEGNIVISVGLFGHSGDAEVWTEGTKEMLDDMHKRKIDMADAIFVINVGGYIGSSTRSEIEYAIANGKEVMYLEEPGQAASLTAAESRVAEQSARLREVTKAFRQAREGLEALEAQKGNIAKLEEYLATEWKADYEADEKGEISKAVARDVLGQDTLYNLLEEISEFNDNNLQQ
ncbi:MAG: DUF4298 domain-containing protein [Bacteroidales bacterium]|nr:DUF4298 domain-containing protein [Bacteroidales bacterium]